MGNKKVSNKTRKPPFIDFASSYDEFGEGFLFSEGYPDDGISIIFSPEHRFRRFVKGYYETELSKPPGKRAWLNLANDPYARSACNAFFNEIYTKTKFYETTCEWTHESESLEYFFWKFRWPLHPKSMLESQEAKERIQQAAAKADQGFFIRLGKELTRKRPKLDFVKLCLIHEWVPRTPGEVGLCDFSNTALADYVSIRLEDYELDQECVWKVRQRLRLLQREPVRVKIVSRHRDNPNQIILQDGRGKQLASVSYP